LISKELVINRYFAKEQQEVNDLNAELESLQNQKTELEEEHGSEEGVFSELDKINKANVTARLKELKSEPDSSEEQKILRQYLDLLTGESSIKKSVAEKEAFLDENLLKYYQMLTEEQIKQLVVEDKWMAIIDKDIHSEMDRISQRLTQRIKELAERYETPLPALNDQADELEKKVNSHLQKMGFVW